MARKLKLMSQHPRMTLPLLIMLMKVTLIKKVIMTTAKLVGEETMGVIACILVHDHLLVISVTNELQAFQRKKYQYPNLRLSLDPLILNSSIREMKTRILQWDH